MPRFHDHPFLITDSTFLSKWTYPLEMHTNSIYFISDIFFLYALFHDLYFDIVIDTLISLKVTKKITQKRNMWGNYSFHASSTIPSKEFKVITICGSSCNIILKFTQRNFFFRNRNLAPN